LVGTFQGRVEEVAPLVRGEDQRLFCEISAPIEVIPDEFALGKQSPPGLAYATTTADGLRRQAGDYADDDFVWEVSFSCSLSGGVTIGESNQKYMNFVEAKEETGKFTGGIASMFSTFFLCHCVIVFRFSPNLPLC